MIRDWKAYYHLLRSLFPRGRAWNTDTGTMAELVQGKAVELARVDLRVNDLLRERDTRYAVELLPEHEADYGLPDACIDPSVLSTAERQLAVNTKLRATGSLMPSYYIQLAESLGYTGVSIIEGAYRPFWSGVGVSGDPCGDQGNLFYWTLQWTFDAGKPWQDGSDINCLLQKHKPAHTIVNVVMV